MLYKKNNSCKMNKIKYVRLLASMLFLSILISFVLPAFITITSAAEKESIMIATGLMREDSYEFYSLQNVNKDKGTANIIINPQHLSNSSEAEIVPSNLYKEGENCVYVKETGYAEFSFDVPDSGKYSIRMDYINFGDTGIKLENELMLDGKIPFYEAGYLTLFSAFKDVYTDGKKSDSRGNDITPEQTEVTTMQSTYFEDVSGLYAEPYEFYLEKGSHTIRIKAVRRDIGICTIQICPPRNYQTYEKALENYNQQGLKPITNYYQRKEAEESLYKSDSSIIPQDDRASSLSVPYSPLAIKLNIIGGGSWSNSGQWISWEIDVPNSGLYKISLRARQNAISGSFVSRSLYVNGEIPFEEAKTIEINYDMGWQLIEIPYYIPLNSGKNIITLKATTGRISNLILKAENSLYMLNLAYRRIVMVTGSIPDTYRDYLLPETVPEAFKIFSEQQKILTELDETLLGMTGSRGSMNGILQTLSKQLKDFIENPDTVQLRLNALKSNISSFGTWSVSAKQQNLELDSIFVYSEKKDLPTIESNIFGYLYHELQSFLCSFVVDYSLIGDIQNSEESIDVWVQTGRDQANIIKDLVTNSFTPQNKINVNIKLVQGQLLAATVAGKGPDAVVQVIASDPVNYAIRKAAVALSDFDGFKETTTAFRDSSIVPFMYNGKTYALPETQTFPVMFYREDILKEIGIKVPTNWPELFRAVGILQKNNMTVGIEAPSSILGSANGMSSMGMFLFQLGGDFYSSDGSISLLSSKNAVSAFETWVSLYTDYTLPIKYDALTRFRIGEMPIVIADYTLFNVLSVAASEIHGLWSFASVPGTEQADGSYRYDVASNGTACMLMNGNNKIKIEYGWEFLKWWTSTDIQYKYGTMIENQLGISARYPTANIEALKKLPWPKNEYTILDSLWKNVHGIPEVAGGYYTSRNINNAFRRVITYKENPKETLMDYVKKINEEISAKRVELGIN